MTVPIRSISPRFVAVRTVPARRGNRVRKRSPFTSSELWRTAADIGRVLGRHGPRVFGKARESAPLAVPSATRLAPTAAVYPFAFSACMRDGGRVAPDTDGIASFDGARRESGQPRSADPAAEVVLAREPRSQTSGNSVRVSRTRPGARAAARVRGGEKSLRPARKPCRCSPQGGSGSGRGLHGGESGSGSRTTLYGGD